MERKVVVAGWGQKTQPKELNKAAKDPMGLMTDASLKASEIMTSKKVLEDLDGIMVVRIVSRNYSSPAKQLAQKLSDNFEFGITLSPQSLSNLDVARNQILPQPQK